MTEDHYRKITKRLTMAGLLMVLTVICQIVIIFIMLLK